MHENFVFDWIVLKPPKLIKELSSKLLCNFFFKLCIRIC